jgi:hypothetical protein
MSGDGILFSGVSFLVLSLLSLLLFMFAAGQFEAAVASVAREGSWIEALYEATVELEEGRDMSWPIDGSYAVQSQYMLIEGGWFGRIATQVGYACSPPPWIASRQNVPRIELAIGPLDIYIYREYLPCRRNWLWSAS